MGAVDNPYPRSATIFAAFCAVTFCVFGVVGNSVTILALIRCPKLRTHATTFFVLSLCTSDLIFCALNLPLTAIRYVYERWTLGDTWCKIFPVIFYGNVALSLLNMVAITLNRYTIISYNVYYKKIYSKTSIWIQVFLIWGISFTIMMLPLLEIWGTLGLDEATFSCTILEKNGTSPKKCFFSVGIVIPCVVIMISYVCIYLKVRSSKRNLEAHQQNQQWERQSRRQRDDRRLTKLMLLIFICFVLCFLPLMCVNVFDDDVKYPVWHVLASILAWASSVVNPVVYAVTNKQYRLAYVKLLNIAKGSISSDSKQCSTSVKAKQVQDQKGSFVFKGPNV